MRPLLRRTALVGIALAAVAAGSIALDELLSLLPPERLAHQLKCRPDTPENVGVDGRPRSAA